MIYFSTGGYKNKTFSDAIEDLKDSNIANFELSGGKYIPNVKDKLLELSRDYNFSIHNYFPPSETPFVFNLGSLNKDILEKSVAHVQDSIHLSSIVGAKFYSFHAGYLIDPQVDELGNKIKKRYLNDRQIALKSFINKVNELSEYAEKLGIKLLIENNVLSKRNYENFGENPLLMVDFEETQKIMKETNENVGLLIDVGHLKVSSKTLKYSVDNFFSDLDNYIDGYHLSDNDGFEDSNDKISKNSWFWKYIDKKADYFSLEIYNIDSLTAQKQFEIACEQIL